MSKKFNRELYRFLCDVFTEFRLGENRKVLAQLLRNLYLPSEVDDVKIRTVKLLVNTITNVCGISEILGY